MNKDLDVANAKAAKERPNLAFVPFTEAVLHKLSTHSQNNQLKPVIPCPQLVPFDLKYGTIEILVENQWVTVIAA